MPSNFIPGEVREGPIRQSPNPPNFIPAKPEPEPEQPKPEPQTSGELSIAETPDPIEAIKGFVQKGKKQ